MVSLQKQTISKYLITESLKMNKINTKSYKPNKEVIITEIIAKLNQGISTPIILAETCAKIQKSERTAYMYINKAKQQLLKLDEKLNKKKEAVFISTAIKSLKKHILDTDKKKEILSKIATGDLVIKKPVLVNGKIVQVECQPDYSDRRNAIAELNKMEGDYSPTKIMQINANFEVLNIDPLSEIENDTTNNGN